MTSGLENSGSRWSREVESGRGVGFRKKAKAADLSVCTVWCSWAFLAVSGPCMGHQADKRRDTVGNSSVAI